MIPKETEELSASTEWSLESAISVESTHTCGDGRAYRQDGLA